MNLSSFARDDAKAKALWGVSEELGMAAAMAGDVEVEIPVEEF